MDIKNLFIRYKIPGQFIYLGDSGTDLFQIKGGIPRKKGSFGKGSPGRFIPVEMREKLSGTDTGIILNPSHFVFNLLTFDKIPFWKKQRDELVNWRIRKVFPENMENYFHSYISFSNNTILSILLKRDLKESLESEAASIGLNLSFIGSSTIEIMNSIRKVKTIPDILVETDGNLMTLVFFRDRVPLYIRKMRSGRGNLPAEEIGKTADYIEKNYGFSPRICSVFGVNSDGKVLEKELAGMKYKILETTIPDMRFIPGVK